MAIPVMSDPEAGPSHSPHRPQRGMVHGGREAVFEGAEALDPALMADDPAGGYSYGGSVTAPGTGTGTGAGSTGGSASGSGSHTGNGTENGQSRSHTQSPAAGQYQYPYPGEQGNSMGANVSPSAQSAQDGTSHPPGSAHSQGQASASGSGAGAIGQEGQNSVMGEDGLLKRVGGKANVSSACGPCKRAHLACDIGRPCKRCVNLGKEAQCEDVPHKKRGRPKVIKPTIGQQQYARLRADVAPGPGSPGPPPSAGAEYGRWRMQPPPYGHGHGHGPQGYMHGPPPPGPPGSYGQPSYAPTGSMPPPPPGAPMNGHGHGAYAHPHASGPGGPPMAGPGSAGLGPGPGGMPPAGMPPGSVAYRGPPPPAEEEPYPPTLFTAFTTPDLRIIRVSSAVTYLTGYHPPEFTNLNLLDWVHRDDRHLLNMERARLIDEPFGPGTLSLDREHHMAALHRPDRDLLSPAAGMREPYPNQNIRFMRPDQQFSHFNARLHLGGALGGSLWSPESFDRVYLVISFLLLPPSNSAPTSAPPTAAPAQPPAGPVAHQGPMRISASGREYAVPAPLTIAPDSRRSSLLGYPPPTPMTPGAHQPMSTAAAAMTPTSLTGTTPGTAGMPTVPAAGTITPGGPLSAAPTAPPGNLPSFSSVAAGSDSPTFKVDHAHVHANSHAHGPQSGYYTPTTAGPSISVSAPPSAVAPGRASGPMSLGSAMASPGMSMAQVQAQAHAQNQAQQHHEAQTQAQHHQQQQHLRHPQYPHAQHQAAQGHPHSQASHAAHNGAPGYQYDRPPTGIYDNRTPSPAHSQSQPHPPSLALDPALAPNGGPYAHSSSRMNGSHPSGPAQNHDPPPSASATSAGGYVDYPPPLQLQQPYYAHDGRYEYRRESDWVPRDAHAQAQGQGQNAHEAAMSAGGAQMEARGMEQARQAQGLAAGETSPGSGEYGRRPWE